MPLWEHIEGYEEGHKHVHEKLALGYPRFVYHPYVVKVVELFRVKHGLKAEEDALPFSNQQVAERCREFVTAAIKRTKPGMSVSDGDVYVADLEAVGVFMTVFPIAAKDCAKPYWQHSGEGASSRQCEAAIKALHESLDKGEIDSDLHPTNEFVSGERACSAPGCHIADQDASAKTRVLTDLRQRIAGLTNESIDNVFLAASGMSTIFTALTSLRRIFPPGYKAVVFGFPYLDTLKMCRRPEWCDGCIFLGQGCEFEDLRDACINDKIMAVFTEFPSNPLLKCPDVCQLRDLADEFGFAVIVDDTLANFCNTDFLGGGHADMLCTSLTKIFSGTGDAMGGSLVVNSKSPLHAKLVADLNANYIQTLYHADAKVLLENGADVERRNAKINMNAEKIYDWLKTKPGIKHVYYPKGTDCTCKVKRTCTRIYAQFMKCSPDAGYGGLMSITLKDGYCPRAFYDNLACQKGPSLGTNYTLSCPYAVLGHYFELDWAAEFGVEAGLVRIAIGLEDIDQLKRMFSDALLAASPHPGVCQPVSSNSTKATNEAAEASKESSTSEPATMLNAMLERLQKLELQAEKSTGIGGHAALTMALGVAAVAGAMGFVAAKKLALR